MSSPFPQWSIQGSASLRNHPGLYPHVQGALNLRRCCIWSIATLCLLTGGACLEFSQSAVADDAAAPAASTPPGSAPADTPPVAAASTAGDSPAEGAAEPPPATVVTAPPPAAPVTPPSAAPVTAPPPPELDPYAVRVSFAFDSAGATVLGTPAPLLDHVTRLLHGRVGELWTLTTDAALTVHPCTADSLAALTDDALNERYGEAGYDKVLLCVVAQQGQATAVTVREWDRGTLATGLPATVATLDRRELPELIADLLWRQFRPLAVVESVDESTIELRIRGGEFLPPESGALSLIRPGDYALPVVRYMDRHRKVIKVQPLPWTYLRIESVDRARALSVSLSPFKNPVPARRRRADVVAIVARPQFPQTRLTLRPRTQPLNPLAACRIDILNRLPTAEDAVEDRLQLISDRSGTVTVPADGGDPLRYVFAHSGSMLLARVPFLVGLQEELTLDVPDDSARLALEGDVGILEGQLIDLVAQRAVVMIRARTAAKEGRSDDVDQLRAVLQSLPNLEAFTARIESVRVVAVEAARRKKERALESRINRMCRDLVKMAEFHLDPDKVRALEEELGELRSIRSGK